MLSLARVRKWGRARRPPKRLARNCCSIRVIGELKHSRNTTAITESMAGSARIFCLRCRSLSLNRQRCEMGARQ